MPAVVHRTGTACSLRRVKTVVMTVVCVQKISAEEQEAAVFGKISDLTKAGVRRILVDEENILFKGNYLSHCENLQKYEVRNKIKQTEESLKSYVK